jgi:hypothetical protein
VEEQTMREARVYCLGRLYVIEFIDEYRKTIGRVLTADELDVELASIRFHNVYTVVYK